MSGYNDTFPKYETYTLKKLCHELCKFLLNMEFVTQLILFLIVRSKNSNFHLGNKETVSTFPIIEILWNSIKSSSEFMLPMGGGVSVRVLPLKNKKLFDPDGRY